MCFITAHLHRQAKRDGHLQEVVYHISYHNMLPLQHHHILSTSVTIPVFEFGTHSYHKQYRHDDDVNEWQCARQSYNMSDSGTPLR
jgi:hypothetical protein